jgi:hypothetical protein
MARDVLRPGGWSILPQRKISLYFVNEQDGDFDYDQDYGYEVAARSLSKGLNQNHVPRA